jgi:hypothetical protein
MWTCKQVADALSKQDYESLTWSKRIGLKLHVALCFVCRSYHKQVMLMQDITRKFRQREETNDMAPDTDLGADVKQRMQEALKKQR